MSPRIPLCFDAPCLSASGAPVCSVPDADLWTVITSAPELDEYRDWPGTSGECMVAPQLTDGWREFGGFVQDMAAALSARLPILGGAGRSLVVDMVTGRHGGLSDTVVLHVYAAPSRRDSHATRREFVELADAGLEGSALVLDVARRLVGVVEELVGTPAS